MPARRSAVARLRPLARPLTAIALFAACWADLHVGLFAREYHKLSGDITIYQGYGMAIRHGAVPYRDFALDYPPGALPAFALPALAAQYGTAFEAAMFLCGLVVVYLTARNAAGWPAVLVVGLSPLLLGDLLRTRFDLWPVALTAGAMAALLRDRHRLGWALLGAAIAAKAYPICLLPLAFLWTSRRAGREVLRWSIAWCAALVGLAFLPALAVGPHGTWVSVWGQVSRPVQIESLPAAILMTARRARVLPGHGSDNIVGSPAQVLAGAVGLLGVCALLWCWIRFAHGPAERDRLLRYAAASVCGFVAFGKVLSPQYLIWLLPFVALVRGRRGLAALGVFTAACLLTHWWIPSRYYDYKLTFAWAWVVLIRDLTLVALFAVLAWPRGWLPRPATEAGMPPETAGEALRTRQSTGSSPRSETLGALPSARHPLALRARLRFRAMDGTTDL